jgi:formiminoglutamase
VRLPLLISVPHGGLEVPGEAVPYCRLTPREIAADGDVGASEIYRLEAEFAAVVSAAIARAIVDMNRSIDDRGKDGVVKTHTCWDVPVYDPAPPAEVIDQILDKYYRPYHAVLSRQGRGGGLLAGIDCHTMAAYGPPVGPDPGAERPWICLSNGDGTCPRAWIEELRDCFAQSLSGRVTINDPFSGGYIARSHAGEMPWIQLEMSRGPFMRSTEKRRLVLETLTRWYGRVSGP